MPIPPLQTTATYFQPFMDYAQILRSIKNDVEPHLKEGRVADYIPALGQISPSNFGIVLNEVSGNVFQAGDSQVPFSVQSISKLFTLTMATQLEGDALWDRMGREPSGDKFNSLIQLEYEKGKPRNPFINAGALVLADIIVSHVEDPKRAILEFVRRLCVNEEIDYDPDVAESERDWGDRNAALAHLMKSFGQLRNSVESVLDTYVHHCALSMTCLDLARASRFLANGGCVPDTGERLLSASQTKRINSLMLTCGVYDAAGDFAYRVGLPGKSGVGGGIVVVMPGTWSAAVWSPALNQNGNSLAGTLALELLTTKTGVSIF